MFSILQTSFIFVLTITGLIHIYVKCDVHTKKTCRGSSCCCTRPHYIYIYILKTLINTIPVFLDDGFKYEAQKGSRLASRFLACRIKGCFVPRGPDSHDLNRQVERAKDPFRC